MPSFAIQRPDLEAVGPIVEIKVTPSQLYLEVLRELGEPIPDPIQVEALIDTGASGTVIKEGIASNLGLNPVGVTFVTGVSGTIRCLTYDIGIIFPNNVRFFGLAVEAPLQRSPSQCIIGRNFLARGVLIYSGFMNTFSFSI